MSFDISGYKKDRKVKNKDKTAIRNNVFACTLHHYINQHILHTPEISTLDATSL